MPSEFKFDLLSNDELTAELEAMISRVPVMDPLPTNTKGKLWLMSDAEYDNLMERRERSIAAIREIKNRFKEAV